MAIGSCTTSFSYDFYLRNYYSSNRNARIEKNRPNIANNTLVMADSSALKKVSAKLRDMEYSSDHATEILRNVKVFTQTYNNLISSAKDSSVSSITKQEKLLNKLTKAEKEDLSSIGFSIGASGKLTLNEETFLNCSPSKLKKILSSDNTLTQSISDFAGKIYKNSRKIDIML